MKQPPGEKRQRNRAEKTERFLKFNDKERAFLSVLKHRSILPEDFDEKAFALHNMSHNSGRFLDCPPIRHRRCHIRPDTRQRDRDVYGIDSHRHLSAYLGGGLAFSRVPTTHP